MSPETVRVVACSWGGCAAVQERVCELETLDAMDQDATEVVERHAAAGADGDAPVGGAEAPWVELSLVRVPARLRLLASARVVEVHGPPQVVTVEGQQRGDLFVHDVPQSVLQGCRGRLRLKFFARQRKNALCLARLAALRDAAPTPPHAPPAPRRPSSPGPGDDGAPDPGRAAADAAGGPGCRAWDLLEARLARLEGVCHSTLPLLLQRLSDVHGRLQALERRSTGASPAPGAAADDAA